MGKDFVPDYHLSKSQGVWRTQGKKDPTDNRSPQEG